MARLVLLLAPFVLSACSASPASALLGDEAISTSVEVHRSADRASWDVTYKFSAPVRRAEFLSRAMPFRSAAFQVQGDAARLESDGARDALVSTAPEGVTEIRLTHANVVAPELRAREMHNLFSNGDVLLFTGYYDVYLIERADGSTEGADQITYKFVTDAAEEITLKSKTSGTTASWTAEGARNRRMYVYFGTLPLVHDEAAGYFAVVDPATPAWVKAKFDASVPLLFRDYQARLFQLPFEPTIFFSAMQPDSEDDDADYSGQVLQGAQAVQISINKDEFQEERDDLTFKLEAALFSHEVVHLWNAHSVESESEEAWLWEGGAEILAQKSISKFGLVKPEYLDWYRRYNFDACLSYLGSVTLPASPVVYQSDEAFDYRCGFLLNYLLAAKTDVFAHWSRLFKTSLATGEKISGAKFLAAAEAETDDPKVRTALAAWIRDDLTPEAARGEWLSSALDSLGETWHRNSHEIDHAEGQRQDP